MSQPRKTSRLRTGCAGLLALVAIGVAGQQPATDLPPASPVITIRHRCPDQAAARESHVCTITVTKQDFDDLVQALDPKMPASNRQSLASEYSRLLIMGAEARRRGIDESPELQTLLRFSNLQTLATRLIREISASPPQVQSHQIAEYFRDHVRDYREVSLSRILVPVQQAASSHGGMSTAMRAEAVRARAKNGEDFAALQREIGVATSGTPEQKVRIGPLPCMSLPEVHRPVCDLEPGEISQALPNSYGYSIYRLESRRSRAFDEVRDEIRGLLERRLLEQEIEKVRTPLSVNLDERYFGKLPKPDLAIEHGMHSPTATTAPPSHPTKRQKRH
jgi:hypothetical protein